MQEKFDHLTDGELDSGDYLEKLIKVMDIMINEDGTGEKKKASRKALFDVMRANDETPAQFALRREAQFNTPEGYGLTLPEDLKGILLGSWKGAQ